MDTKTAVPAEAYTTMNWTGHPYFVGVCTHVYEANEDSVQVSFFSDQKTPPSK